MACAGFALLQLPLPSAASKSAMAPVFLLWLRIRGSTTHPTLKPLVGDQTTPLGALSTVALHASYWSLRL
jgi:hypothetical protein